MSENMNFRPHQWICWVCLGVMAVAGGCKRGEIKQGKFSDEEMEAIGLVTHDDLPRPSGALVLSVNAEAITSDEILSTLAEMLNKKTVVTDFETFNEYVRPIVAKVILDKTTDILLYQQAKKNAPDNIEEMLDNYVETEVNKFVAGYGGNNARAQQAIEKMGLDWQGFRKYKKRLILTQNYIAQEIVDDKPITHSEMLTYYNTVKSKRFSQEAMIKFRLIDIRSDKVEVMADSSESARDAALNMAKEVVEKIDAGEDFAALASQYSHGHRASFGGLWKPVKPPSLAEPYDILEKEAMNMWPGEVIEAIEAGKHVFIMKLEDKQDASAKPFESVQAEIETEIRFRRKKAQFDKMIAKLIEQASMPNMEMFVDFCVEAAYRRYGG